MAEATSTGSSRILKEKADLAQHFDEKNIRWNEATVELDITTFSGKQYTLRLYIPDFPNSYPMLAVVKPTLSIPSNKPELHSLGQHEGFPTVSHYPSTDWHSDYFIHQIFKKGVLWVRAYEEHLAAGGNVDNYLRLYRQQSNVIPSWSEVQMKRLAREKENLELFYPGHGQVKWSDDRRAVDVNIQSYSQKNTYTLRLYLEADFPNSCPELAIVSPEELLTVNGEPLPGNSQEFRTLERGEDGHLRICHFGPNEWMDRLYISKVFTKGQAWVNAYEKYLQKGERFEDCLRGFYQEGATQHE